jgi:Fic family protein
MTELLKDINILNKQYKDLGIEQSLDWYKHNYYSIVHHSTSIEGSSLTQEETELLLDEDISAKGKPLMHHHMQKDHYQALLFILDAANKKAIIDIDFLRRISSIIMQNTGSTYNTISGSFDSSKGELRLLNNYAGETRFPDFKKVPALLKLFCDELNSKLDSISNPDDILFTAFDAHFNLVTIHPFADGNGRISRLIMNYIQHRFDQPMTIVFKEDKAEYYKALVDTRKHEDIKIFRKFMLVQHIKYLTTEIDKVLISQKKVKILLNKKKKDKGKGLGLSMLYC